MLPLGAVLALGDVVAVVATGLTAGVTTTHAALALVVSAYVAVLVAAAADLYRSRLVLSIVQELPALIVVALAATAVRDSPTPAALAAYSLVTLALLVLFRTVLYTGTHLLRRSGRLGTRVLVVGTGSVGRRMAFTLREHPEYGLRPIGYVDTDHEPTDPDLRGLALPLLGEMDRLLDALGESRAGGVLLALPAPPDEAEQMLVDDCLAAGAVVYAAPRYVELAAGRTRRPREVVGETSVLRLHRRGSPAVVRSARRLVGALVAAVALVLLVPVFLVVSLLVRIETGGVIVRQPRVDELGHAVTVPKFRTRRAASMSGDVTSLESGVVSPAGPVGRALRRTRLDGLPHLVQALTRRLRPMSPRPGRVVPAPAPASATPGSDQTQVDAGQLAG